MWHSRCSERSGSLVAAACFGLILCVTTAACGGNGQTTRAELDETEGRASYYADQFAGKTTASGEPFDPRAMTAAHPHLPFGTRVRVTRMKGAQRSVVVRINDRGPYTDDRIIDLSEAAAEELGMIDEGVVEVRLELVNAPEADADASSGRGGDGW
jgi:rare lipoprotein A